MLKATTSKARTMREMEDVELLVAIKAGSGDAFSEFWRRWWRVVFFRGLKRLGNWEAADEVVSQLFSKLYERREHYDPTITPLRWVFSNLKWVMKEVRASMRRRFPQLAHDDDSFFVDHQPDPEELQRQEETAWTLRTRVESLPPKQVGPVVSIYFKGESMAEFGRETGRSFASIESSLYAAIRNLRSDPIVAQLATA